MAVAPPTRDRAGIAAEADFLLASLRDLEREHRAGDVDDEDYRVLRASYVERAARALRELEAASGEDALDDDRSGPTEVGTRPVVPLARVVRLRRFLGRPRTRRALGLGAAASFVVVAALVATELAGVRLPGDSTSGSISLSNRAEVARELTQASTLANEGQVTDAIATYEAVLKLEPDNAVALTYRGWLVRLAAIAAGRRTLLEKGDASIARAASTAPRYADAEGLYGIVLLQDRDDPPAALARFRAFLADDPSKVLVGELGETMAAAFESAHAVVPRALQAYEKKPAAST